MDLAIYIPAQRITGDQFEALRDHFNVSVEIKSLDSKSPVPGHATEGGGESQAHLSLKEYVAANPSIVLCEPLVETVAVERAFPTGDRADIVMRDQFGRIIGLEIELDIPNGDITGPLQAIKYRRMLEMVSGLKHGDGSAILVAHAIPDDVRQLCDQYEVECFVVNRSEVQAWVAKSKAV